MEEGEIYNETERTERCSECECDSCDSNNCTHIVSSGVLGVPDSNMVKAIFHFNAKVPRFHQGS